MTPDLTMYTEVVDNFLSNAIDAATFTSRYMETFTAERRMLGSPWYEPLNEIFLDSDEYVDDPTLWTGIYCIDEKQLRERVLVAREQLRALLGY